MKGANFLSSQSVCFPLVNTPNPITCAFLIHFIACDLLLTGTDQTKNQLKKQKKVVAMVAIAKPQGIMLI
jgi:hypothetical protein